MPFRPSLRWDQEEFVAALAGATGHEALLEARAYDVVCITAPNGDFRWISPSVQQFLGWEPAETIGVNSADLVHPDDRPLVLRGRSDVEADTSTHSEFRLRAKDGTYHTFRTAGAALRRTDGTLAGRIGGWRSIDDLVVERDRAMRSERQVRTLLDSMSDAHVIIRAVRDDDERIVDFVVVDSNHSADRFFGRSHDQVTGARITQLVDPSALDTFLATMGGALANATAGLMIGVPGPAHDPDTGNNYFDVVLDPVEPDTFGVRWRDTTAQVAKALADTQHEIDRTLEMERNRISLDLHDGVTQQVLYTGMALTALLPDLPESTRTKVERVIERQDDITRQLRATVLALTRPDLTNYSPSAMVGRTAREATMHLDLAVDHVVDGPLDEITDTSVVHHMLFTLRELIVNVVRHAHASSVHISVLTTADRLTLTVTDDGDAPERADHVGQGLTNIEERAASLGGSFNIVAQHPAGAIARWSVPLGRHGSG